MAQSISHSEPFRESSNEPATPSRLRTVTGNKFPRKCSCGYGFQIPRDPEIRYVVDFGAPKRYPAYLGEHSPGYRTCYESRARKEDTSPVPGFHSASAMTREPPKPPVASRPTAAVAHEASEARVSRARGSSRGGLSPGCAGADSTDSAEGP